MIVTFLTHSQEFAHFHTSGDTTGDTNLAGDPGGELRSFKYWPQFGLNLGQNDDSALSM